jgi:hypothetical protein
MEMALGPWYTNQIFVKKKKLHFGDATRFFLLLTRCQDNTPVNKGYLDDYTHARRFTPVGKQAALYSSHCLQQRSQFPRQPGVQDFPQKPLQR